MDKPTSTSSSGRYADWRLTRRICACCRFNYPIAELKVVEFAHVGTGTPPVTHLLCEACHLITRVVEQDWKVGAQTIEEIATFLREWWVAREG